jgi:hypothetical protein
LELYRRRCDSWCGRCGADRNFCYFARRFPQHYAQKARQTATADSFSVTEIPRLIELEPFKILDHLINGWCERRALRPLRYLLDAYPGVLAHTDQQFDLVEALKNVKALCRDDLTEEERHLVRQACDFFEERLRARVI